MNAAQNAKLGRTCTKRDGEDTRARTHTHTRTHAHTNKQANSNKFIKKTPNIIQNKRKKKLQKKLVL